MLKTFFLAAGLLILSTGCAKMTYPCAVVCNFPNVRDGQNWLVVCREDGSIVKIFGIPAFGSQVTEQIEEVTKDPDALYSFHLVHAGRPSDIRSIYGVRSGAAAVFSPADLFTAAFPVFSTYHVSVLGVEGVDSISLPGDRLMEGVDYNDHSHVLSVTENFYGGRNGLVIRVRPQPGSPFYSLYLPASTLATDSVTVHWSDFSVENQFQRVDLPTNDPVDGLHVSAIAPDFSEWTTLYDYLSYVPFGTFVNRVPLPAGLPVQTSLFVQLTQGNITLEKLFAPGERLQLAPPEIDVKAGLFLPFRTLQIATGGSPDLVEAHAFLTDAPGGFRWHIYGPPEAFEKMKLPDLSVVLPELTAHSQQSISWVVTATRYDRLDYGQILAGFPYKGADGSVLPTGRSGSQAVTKRY